MAPRDNAAVRLSATCHKQTRSSGASRW